MSDRKWLEESLRLNVKSLKFSERMIASRVAELRATGATWDEIAKISGVSQQVVRQRFGR